MLQTMTWSQFREWQLYADLEPFGEERADLRAGIIASTIANANRGKNQRHLKPTDFMPYYEGKRSNDRKPLTDPKAWGEFKSLTKRLAGAN